MLDDVQRQGMGRKREKGGRKWEGMEWEGKQPGLYTHPQNLISTHTRSQMIVYFGESQWYIFRRFASA